MSGDEKKRTYQFLLSGRDERGRRVTDLVDAECGDDAFHLFEDRGFSEIALHTDDTVAPFQLVQKEKGLLSLRDQVRIRTHSPLWLALFLAFRIYLKAWYMVIPLLGWMTYRLITGWEWDIWTVVVFTLLLIPVAFGALLLWSIRPYAWMLRAVGWARWDEVLRLLPRLKRMEFAPQERPVRRAQGLAGTGRLSKALDVLDAAWESNEWPEYLYWEFQALVYAAAKDREQVLRCLARGYELAPTIPAVIVDYASQLLAIRRDTRQARPLLAEARRHAISDTTMPFLLAAEGLLNLEEGRPAEAVEPLTESVRQLDPFLRGNPSMIAAGARIRAYLSLALAATGETVEARHIFQHAKPLLVAHKDHELLERCEQAL